MDQFPAHLSNVSALAIHGISPPPEWTAQCRRWTDYVALSRPLSARLAAEITDPGSTG